MPKTVEVDPSNVPLEPIEKANKILQQKNSLPLAKFKEILTENTPFSQTTAKAIIQAFNDQGLIEVNKQSLKTLRMQEIKRKVDSQEFDADSDMPVAEQASYFADYLIEHRGIKPVEIGEGSESRVQIWSYDETKGTWHKDGMKKPKRIAKSELPRRMFNTNFINQLENNLESSIPIQFSEMGLQRDKIPLNNGILDVKTLELEDINQSDYVLNRIPVDFNQPENFVDSYENLGCPKWGEFLKESVPDEQQRKKLQEFVGYTLMHWSTKYEKALMLLGPTDSGKGVFLNTVEHLIGPKNVCNHGLQYLANKMWGRQDLASNMANIRHDLDTELISKMGKAKEIISGDPIMAAKKSQDPVKINPVAKHLYSANTPPKRKIEDEAFYNRFLTVIFPDSVPKEDQDDELVEKLTGKTRNGEESHEYEGELQGIFNWALAGLKRLKQNKGKFTGEVSPAATQQLWQEYGSTVSNFKEEFMVKEEGAKIPTRAAYEAYKMYAEVDGLETESHSGFSRQVNNDPEIRKGSRKINGESWSWVEDIDEDDNSKRCFIGIRLKSGTVDELRELAGGEEIF